MRLQFEHPKCLGFALVLFVAAFCASNSALAQTVEKASGQTVYVPAYTQVLTKEGRSEPLAAMLFIHNVDPNQPIMITGVDYFAENGALLKSFATASRELVGFESTRTLVPIGSSEDGIGANFIVTWTSSKPAIPPIVETVMTGGSGVQGISLTSRGRVIEQSP
ncbi:DUF3124 domain-containing protein [Shimia sp. Alg240-R146]|uniref:DUF3124 domain-containing protein n=1 Tax=Shimia sp. Alg240-R146 TaxID=2993449 RepID=UPI0022E3040C|nr:DUF3124 domain-containing protein [Shimia sp. Alg240-R146]